MRAGTALDRTEAFVRPTGGARQQAAGMAETRIGAIDARVREMVTELRRLPGREGCAPAGPDRRRSRDRAGAPPRWCRRSARMSPELELIVVLLFYALIVWAGVWLCLLLGRSEEVL